MKGYDLFYKMCVLLLLYYSQHVRDPLGVVKVGEGAWGSGLGHLATH